ncbi:hypothetical protein [Tumebacillus permanentifrigoris]|uniref:Collagen triple helix repeat protein n=1 Tax=Tumebacillus permanentifrigoris TaxID=378543 RepID=A0A316D9J0_9BACL|nr:hypothetical protein [Tumebacillus permanentifrigoris]PWK11602.1 hypothetical protein C7459_110131 [Tumebacillus permanentifrigoris]
MANLTEYQLQKRNQFLQELGLDESAITQGVVQAEGEGTFYLSTRPEHNSVIKPHFVTVQTVDDLKRLGGIPDAVYANRVMEEHHAIPQEWSAEKNDLALTDLTREDEENIGKAYNAYLYGNSEKVQSYREIIQKKFFPMQMPVFLANDLVVNAGQTYVVTSQGSTQPVGVGFDSVTVNTGGTIVNLANATWKVQNFTASGDGTGDGNYCSYGADGAPGGNGGTPGKAQQGNQGSKGVDGDCGSCSTAAGKGDTGHTGAPGGNGGQGQNGSDGAVVNATFTTVQGNVTVCSSGGNGGNGGNAGNGGQGGDGGPGGASSSNCGTGQQGQGGQGGVGGNGGNAGNGGNGKQVYINYEEIATGASISILKPKGVGGTGGTPGNGGQGGNGVPNGGGGAPGVVGTSGTSGQIGTIYINGAPAS